METCSKVERWFWVSGGITCCPGSSWVWVNSFLVDGAMLCFGFRMRTVVVTRCFSCCWSWLMLVQGLSSFSYCPARKETRGVQDAGRGHSWDTKGYLKLCGTMLNMLNSKMRAVGLGVAASCSGAGWTSISEWWAIASRISHRFFYHYYYFLVILLPNETFFILFHGFYLCFFVSLLQSITLTQSSLHPISGEKGTLKDWCKCQNI